ncbi:hypothetical protein Lal_00036939 [Lupinus albus]|uniref:Glycosyltransferase n=1 Tax=Lupinus albus TaxID=3870 RepID=A0A6A5NRC0_LUPAL|nr:putative flavonol 3-O-glucosyltransferase [Lupinus albus]KAF1888897.1 hypothetical protein Lal_00036939 [Lupinus albus]
MDGSFGQHVVLFPFMSKGHTIPLLHFARLLLLRHNTAVTVFTTPSNHPFVAASLHGTTASIVVLPFPTVDGIESTDQLPSMSLFYKFATTTATMQPHFEHALEYEITIPRITFMVTDSFLWWTLQSATKFNVPRFAYFGMSCYSVCLLKEAAISGMLGGTQPDDELVTLTRFPWIKLCKNDFEAEFRNLDPKSVAYEFNMKLMSAIGDSYGMLVNSFYELEHVFVDHINTEPSPKSWCVGPFCFAQQTPNIHLIPGEKPRWFEWLDEKLEEKGSVLYVAFGSQAEISDEQLNEIAKGLEESMVNFLWVIRKGEWDLPDGFEERVEKRGIVVREWVDQWEILMHESVEGFLSHCGWNSVLESICAGVPILAWPMMAEQHLNARMVDEEIKIGLRVETCDGSVRGFVKCEGLRKSVKELMEGEKGREGRKKVMELADIAKNAIKEGGSSCSTLNLLLQEICTLHKESPPM